MYSLILLLTLVNPVRDVTDFAPILNDVQSQLQEGHQYTCDNDISTVHECTHGINSRLRGLYGKPSFYVLNNKAIILEEPKGTLRAVAKRIPLEHQGKLYQLYLVDARRWWDEQPTYVFDEFSSYINGAQARKELGRTDREALIENVGEFVVYSICVPWSTNNNDPKMKAFLRYQIDRALALGAGEHLDIDGELKDFMVNYFGAEWVERRFK